MTIAVREARAEDVPALVRLRLSNAERHVDFDPAGHRLPEEAAIRRDFERVLSGSAGRAVQVLVAEVSGTVAGMSEIVMHAAPPPHQILVPRRSADVHTVVLERFRGQGVGTALLAAAERHAARRGVSRLFAPILAANADAVSFYSRAAFGDYGIIMTKEVTADGGDLGLRELPAGMTSRDRGIAERASQGQGLPRPRSARPASSCCWFLAAA